MHKIKQTAKELNITQKELAQIMGVAHNTLSYWISGANPTPKWVLKMCDLLIIEKRYNMIKEWFSEQNA